MQILCLHIIFSIFIFLLQYFIVALVASAAAVRSFSTFFVLEQRSKTIREINLHFNYGKRLIIANYLTSTYNIIGLVKMCDFNTQQQHHRTLLVATVKLRCISMHLIFSYMYTWSFESVLLANASCASHLSTIFVFQMFNDFPLFHFISSISDDMFVELCFCFCFCRSNVLSLSLLLCVHTVVTLWCRSHIMHLICSLWVSIACKGIILPFISWCFFNVQFGDTFFS